MIYLIGNFFHTGLAISEFLTIYAIMEKEQEQKPENDVDPLEGKTEASTVENQIDVKFDKEEKEQKNEITPEEKINELEDKLESEKNNLL